MIFSEYERSDDSPKKMSESDFAFLDRSPRPEIAAVRSFVMRLLEVYPQDGVAEMVARIRSGDSVAFRSAGFELLIYDFLTRLDYKLQPHPVLKNGSEKKPDFHVVAPDGSEFYLEAVLATEDRGENQSADAMIKSTLDFLNFEPHKNFYISITSKGEPKTQPSGKKIRREVMRWLDGLNPDEVPRIGNVFATNPSIDIQHEDWTLNVQAIPASPEKRGKIKRFIGLQSGRTGFVDSSSPIRKNLKGKGQRYGELNLPLIVALNFSAFNLDAIDEMQALYGDEQITVSSSEFDAEPKVGRAPNGLWRGPDGPRGSRVSGAWLFNDLTFYTAAKRKQTLYFNPWPIHPLPEILKELPHATMLEDFTVKWEDGLSLREVLDLSEDWPE
jgi:hypothetical protein